MADTLQRGIAWGAGIGLLLALSPLACGVIFGRQTRYCPFDHFLRGLSSCAVLDKSGDRALIQHADLDRNEYYLELREGGLVRYFEMPETITRLAPGGYSGKLVPGVSDAILIDGKRVQLHPTSEP